MPETELTSTFFVRLSEGTTSAAELVDERFRQKLCSLVENELHQRFAARLDPEDVVQPAMRSFFRGIDRKGWRVESEEALWGLLAAITRTKIKKTVEQQTAEKREPDREVDGDWLCIPSPAPSAEDVVLVADMIEHVVADLRPPDPEIFRLRLEGHSIAQIAQMTGVPRSRVRITLNRIRNRLQRFLRDMALE
jgi:RNA polymerase sigma factor (sigma-70 family)